MSDNPKSILTQYPFGGGMQQYADPRLLEPPSVISAQNVRSPKPGQYTKRPGTSSAYSTIVGPSWLNPTLSAGKGVVASLGDTLFRADEKWISVSSTARAAMLFRGWAPLGMPRVRSLWSEASSDGVRAQITQVDCAAGTGANGQPVVAVAYYSSVAAETRIVVYDATTWTPINITDNVAGSTAGPAVRIPGYHWPRLLWLGAHLYVAVLQTGANTIEYRRISTSTWAMDFLILLVNGTARENATGPRAWYDVAKISDTEFALAYQDTANALIINKYAAANGVQIATKTSAQAAVAIDAIGISATDTEFVWVTYVVNATAQTRVTCIDENTWAEQAGFPANGPGTLRNTPLCSTSVRVSATSAMLAYSDYGSGVGVTDQCEVIARTIDSTATLGTPATFNINTMLVGKGIASGGRYFLPVVHGGAGQTGVAPTLGLAAQWSLGMLEYLEGRTSGPVFPCIHNALVVPLTATGLEPHWITNGTTTAFAPCSAALLGTTYYHAWSEIAGVVGYDAIREQLDLASYDTSKTDHLRPALLGGAGYFAGLIADAGGVNEHGFLHRPEVITPANGGAGSVANGTYQYRAIYVTVTRTGKQIRSAPSNNVQHVVGAGPNAVTVTVPNPTTALDRAPHSYQTSQTFVEVYRTTAGSSGPYYWVARAAMVMGAYVTVVTDTLADATIQIQPQIYTGDLVTQRSSMANVPAPTAVHTIVHKDRPWLLWPDRRTVQPGDKLVTGEVCAVHSEVTLTVDDELTCLFSLDESIGAMSERAIYLMQGDGPSNRYPGADSDYRGFSKIATDVGCSDSRSLCTTPEGIVFRSRNGLNLLNRGGGVQPFGLEVQDELDANTLNTSIVLHPSNRYLFVTCENGSTGVRLVYDYRSKTWTKDPVRAGAANERILSQCVHNGAVHFLAGSDGAVYKEDASTYLDAGNWVTMSATLAPFKSTGPLGWQGLTHCYWLSERHTPHGQSMTVEFDHGTILSETQLLTDAEVTAFASSPIIQWCKSIVSSRENQAARLTLQDSVPSNPADIGTGRGATWIAHAYDSEPKKDAVRLPPAQQR